MGEGAVRKNLNISNEDLVLQIKKAEPRVRVAAYFILLGFDPAEILKSVRVAQDRQSEEE